MSSASDLPLEIDVQSVKQLLDSGSKLMLLDVREQDEYALAHIAGAMLVPMREVPESLDRLEEFRDAPLVVHCHHGGRSMRVVQWLRQKGYGNAQNMVGGIDAWSQIVDPSVPRY